MTPESNVLVIGTDSFGGRGGIAKYNRDFLTALSADPRVSRVTVLPRLAPDPINGLPVKLEYLTTALGGMTDYASAFARVLARRQSFDIVVCAHMNLLPFGALASLRFGAKLLLLVYGVEAWERPSRKSVRLSLPRVHAIASISTTTLQRMQAWNGRASPAMYVLPNAFEPELFAPGPKPDYLCRRYGLDNRRVVLVLGRMVASEGRKGFDEMLDALPSLVAAVPDVALVLAGDGDDRSRLVSKARLLGVEGHTVFPGYIAESEKADHYRMSDVCILPSRQEGFGFVLLEAMACGIPSIGSVLDGSREAVLNGDIGLLVDPTSQQDIARVVCEALAQPKGIPRGLEYFDFSHFQERLSKLTSDLLTKS